MSIKNFEEIILPQLEQFSTVVDYKLEKLLSTGENYGSIMYKVEVIIKNGGGKDETLHMVAKTTPPKSWIWELFTTVVTFKKELSFYQTIAPALDQFLTKQSLPGFLNSYPKYYGSRVTLQPNSDEVDEDAVLMLENLKFKGYDIGNRFIGFNLDVSKAIIDIMAKNHAVIIAYKEYHQKDFEETLLPPMEARFKSFLTDERIKELVSSYKNTLNPTGFDLTPHEDSVINTFNTIINTRKQPTPDSVFNTFCHNDLWTNNIMLKIEDNKKIHVKLVDYQVTEYRLGSTDLIFFLFSSVELPILREKIDHLIDYYYGCFIDTLTKLGVDINKFKREEFEETVQVASQTQLAHVLMLLAPIFTMKGKAKELKDFQPEDFKPNMEDLHENYLPRLHFIITEFVRRKWL